MVRNFKPKTDRANINETTMHRALFQILSKNVSQREASKVYGIKRQTLQSRIKKILEKMTVEEYLQTHGNDDYESVSDSKLKYASRKVFTSEEEDMLATYLVQCCNMNYGLSYDQVRRFVYDYAKMLPNKTYHKSWDTNKKAGIEWLSGFMSRHKNLSLRKPEATSMARGIGFNKTRVDEFFNNYKTVLERHQLTADRIYNLDETGITTVLKPPKIIAPKGKKQIGLVSSAERGELVTLVGIVSAAGTALPPVFIFPRVRNIEDYLEGGPASSMALGNSSGWMTQDLFVKTLKHVVKHTQCSQEKKILLLLDNHESHTKAAAIHYARNNGIVLLSYPPHTSHKLQALDVGVFGPFKQKCAVSFHDWLISHPGKTISVKMIPKLTRLPFLESFTPRNIISSFETPGLWPVNSFAFTEKDFDATYVYHEPPIPENKMNDLAEEIAVENRPSTSTGVFADSVVIVPKETSENKEATTLETPSRSSVLTPEFVRPFPKVLRLEKKTKPKANQGKSRIYTDTPEKDRIEEMENEKLEKQKQKEEKAKKKLKRVLPKNDDSSPPRKDLKMKKINQVKKKVFDSSSESDDSDISYKDVSDDDISLDSLNDSDQIEVSNFILVKFDIPNGIMYYIGCVQDIISDDLFRVKFLRRRAVSNKFYFPQVDDVEKCQRDSIIAVLKNPLKSRRDSSLTFQYNFNGLNVK